MLQYIRNFYHQMFFNPDESFQHAVPDDSTNKKDSPVLTQSELQMLQRIVADAIFEKEQYWKGAKYDAQIHRGGSDERNFWFKQARKHKTALKKLSTLQYRLKHKISTWG